MNDYYVYTLAYPDGTVFYVGKGKGNRIRNHLDETRRGVQSPKCDIIRSIWAANQSVLEDKIATDLSEKDALALEEEIIDRYDFSTLANKRKRGNCKWITPEWRERRSKTAKETSQKKQPMPFVFMEIRIPKDMATKLASMAKANGRTLDLEIDDALTQHTSKSELVLRAHGVDIPQSMHVETTDE